ncbi:MAG: DsrE family protein [Sulfolobaceae archaeon]|nr:DsrE family protein [Sulfolobaceae archaeon]
MKVVVQISEREKVQQSIRSVINLVNELKDELEEVEVVFHQSAIFATTDRELLKPLYRDKIKVVACKNSLIAQNIKEEALAEGIKIVNSGVAEIVRKQKEGWIYLRL